MPRTSRTAALLLASILLFSQAASAAEITVLVSGAFTEAYLKLVPEFERATNNKIVTAYGASMGDTPTSIPSRLKRGEPADVVILAASALDELIKNGQVRPESRTDLVRSNIGMVVRKGAPHPDISSIEALKRTLLAAKSIAYSDSASGVYLSTTLFPRLGIPASKGKKIAGEPVAAVVARGEADLGFQQISELLPVPGVDYVGPLPPGAQQVTIFSAGVTKSSKNPDAAKALIKFLASSTARPAIIKSGLEPVP